MGKITGFMEFERIDEGYKPVPERLKHYKEFVIGLSPEQAKTQSARCMDCGTPFCNSGCPVNNIIPDWNDLVFRQEWRRALDVLHSTNNFPEFTGRICPAPCEAACTLNINDDAVGIKSIEHAIIDKGWEQDWVVPQPPTRKTGKKVAVVGSGPSGLACAQQLARAGHAVTVFEKSDRIGGLLRYGIPDFKLEKFQIDRRIGNVVFTVVNLVFHVFVIHFNRGLVLIIVDVAKITKRILPRNLRFDKLCTGHPQIAGKGRVGIADQMDILVVSGYTGFYRRSTI